MMQKRTWFLGICLIFVFFVGAKGQQRQQQLLKDAQTLVKTGQLDSALKVVESIVAYNDAINNLTPKAEWLYAGCLEQKGNFKQALTVLTFTATKGLTTNDRKQNTALIAGLWARRKGWSIAWRQGNGIAGLDTLQERLERQMPLDTLLFLQSQLEYSTSLLASAKRRLPLEARKKYHLDRAKELGVELPIEVMNRADTVNLALFLPLELNKNTNRQSSAVWDFVQGALMAKQVLSDTGAIKLELTFYDHQREEFKLRQLMEEAGKQDFDAWIGPVSSSLAQPFAKGAAQWHIPAFNPLARKGVDGAKNLYFTNPGNQQMLNSLVKLRESQMWQGKAAIIYGTEGQDSVIAKQYKEAMTKAGIQIGLFRKVGKLSAGNLIKFISQAKLDSTGHIMVFSDEPLVGQQLLSTLDVLRLNIPIVARESFLETPDVTLEQLARRRVHILGAEIVLPKLRQHEALMGQFKIRFGQSMSIFAAQGYDMVLALSQAVAEKRKNLSNYLSEFPIHGPLLHGYDFTDGNINKDVPIYRVTRSGLEEFE